MFTRVRGGDGVVAGVVEREEVAWGKVDVEFAREFARLLGRA